MREADCVVLGGHSVTDPEIKFGYSVTGTIHPDRIKTNAGARPGDVLVLTKTIGTGVISTALKRGIADPGARRCVHRSMLTLNRAAAEAMARLEVHAVSPMSPASVCSAMRAKWRCASNVTLEIDSKLVQFLSGRRRIRASRARFPAGLKNNREFVAELRGGIVGIRRSALRSANVRRAC